MDPAWIILFVVLVIIFSSVGGGWFWNSRRSKQILRWLQPGLKRFADKVSIRWLNAATVELKLLNVRLPFKELTTLVVLPPRHIPWLWLQSLIQRRSEMLVFRSQMIRELPCDGEILQPGTWAGKIALANINQPEWESQSIGKYQLLAVKNDIGRLIRIVESSGSTSPDGLGLLRLSLRQKDHRLDVQVTLPRLSQSSASDLCENLKRFVKNIF
jgi:hypothetical protein